MKKDTLRTIATVAMTLIIISLTVKLYIDQSKLDCSLCQLELKSQLPASTEFYDSFNYSVNKLYEEHKEGICSIRWDKNTGFSRTIENG